MSNTLTKRPIDKAATRFQHGDIDINIGEMTIAVSYNGESNDFPNNQEGITEMLDALNNSDEFKASLSGDDRMETFENLKHLTGALYYHSNATPQGAPIPGQFSKTELFAKLNDFKRDLTDSIHGDYAAEVALDAETKAADVEVEVKEPKEPETETTIASPEVEVETEVVEPEVTHEPESLESRLAGLTALEAYKLGVTDAVMLDLEPEVEVATEPEAETKPAPVTAVDKAFDSKIADIEAKTETPELSNELDMDDVPF